MIRAHLSAVSRWHDASGLKRFAKHLPGTAQPSTLRFCVNYRSEMFGIDAGVLVTKHLRWRLCKRRTPSNCSNKRSDQQRANGLMRFHDV
jgi:hypothetical protein